MKDVIIGGSGWVSRVAIQLLISKFGTETKSLYVFGSRRRHQLLDNGLTLEIREWKEIQQEESIRFFLPLAFLTVDKFQLYGEGEFRRKNLELIEKASAFLAINKPQFCVLMSSGIVNSDLLLSRRNAAYHVYRELKIFEEEVIKEQCKLSGTNLVICHLYSASGRGMTDTQKYAISNLAYQGLKNGTIKVDSPFRVLRRYVDMEQLLEICFRAVQEFPILEFDSTGYLVELHDLADLFAKILGIAHPLNKIIEVEADNYFSNSRDMELLADKYGVKLFSLEKQVNETIQGVKRLMKLDI